MPHLVTDKSEEGPTKEPEKKIGFEETKKGVGKGNKKATSKKVGN